MYVLPITKFNCDCINTSPKTRKPTFGVNERWVYDDFGKPLYKTTTEALRNDIPWGLYVNKVCNKYKDEDAVKVMIHACSSGLEGLSFLLSLLCFRPREVDKFTPIVAKDINPENIKQAQSGRFEVSLGDVGRLNNFTNNRLNEFFDLNIRGGKYYLLPKQNITNRIIFQQGDVFEDVKRLPSKNTVLHVMNMWPYLSKKDREILADSISNQFPDDTSLVAIGNYDCSEKVDTMLLDRGFAEDLEVRNIFSRPVNIYKYTSILY